MEKYKLIVLGLFLAQRLMAQHDSLNGIHFSAIQVDIGPNIYANYENPSQQNYQKTIKNNVILNQNFSTYQSGNSYFRQGFMFNGMLSVKVYADIQRNKKFKREVYIGLKYREDVDAGLSYRGTRDSVITTFKDVNSNNYLYRVQRQTSYYYFNVFSRQLIMPFGINISSNKQRVFWITLGLEMAPSFSFDYRFQATKQEISEVTIIDPTDTSKSQNSFNSFNNGISNITTSNTKLNGIDVGFFASLPFTMYLRPSKKVKILKHLNLLASVTPAYTYFRNRHSGNVSGINLLLATGVRYNL